MKRITLTIVLTASVLASGCASTPKDPGLTQICGNVSELYAQSYELRSYGATKGQALAFMGDMTKEIEPKESREFILSHAQSAVHSVYDNPKTSKSDWKEGVYDQCLDKPLIPTPGS